NFFVRSFRGDETEHFELARAQAAGCRRRNLLRIPVEELEVELCPESLEHPSRRIELHLSGPFVAQYATGVRDLNAHTGALVRRFQFLPTSPGTSKQGYCSTWLPFSKQHVAFRSVRERMQENGIVRFGQLL